MLTYYRVRSEQRLLNRIPAHTGGISHLIQYIEVLNKPFEHLNI